MLVDDAFVKLIGDSKLTWENRAHFYGLAARAMRDILVDDARRRAALKRGGGGDPARLDAAAEPVDPSSADPLRMLALNDALTAMAVTHPELVTLVELHHFGGWELKQIAEEILKISYATAKRRWEKARALLYRSVYGGDDDADLRRTAR
jgi:RNA polymerase sigma factor (TIGR02999 family)